VRYQAIGPATIGLLLTVAALTLPAAGQSAKTGTKPSAASNLEYGNPRPGAPGHRAHIEWQGGYPKLGTKALTVVATLRPPDGFIGNMTYNPAADRLYLISLGRPTNPNNSSIYEMDASTGKILATAALPQRSRWWPRKFTATFERRAEGLPRVSRRNGAEERS
jgi:hypothetical protein